MKTNIAFKFVLFLASLLTLWSCEDRELVTVENNGAPMVIDLSAESLVLDKNFPNNPALTIAWNPATYSVPVQISYRVEVSADEAFTTPVLLGTVTESATAVTYTTSQINGVAGSLGFEPFVASTMYVRVSSFLGTNTLASVSNVTSLSVTPYVLAYPDFYIVGEASYVGWTAANAQLLHKNEEFATIYTYLENGKEFRFLGQKDWNPLNYSINAPGIRDEYKYFITVSDNIIKGAEDENMKFTGATGIYKLVINAKDDTKSLKATASPIPGFDFPEIYLVGNIAGNGWSAENGIAMTNISAGVFEFTTALAADTEFKILGQKSWGDLEWANLGADNAGDTGFLGPKGDNGNIKFTGDGSNYKITVNLKAGTYKIVKI